MLIRKSWVPTKGEEREEKQQAQPCSLLQWHNWFAPLFFSGTTLKWVTLGYAFANPTPYREIELNHHPTINFLT